MNIRKSWLFSFLMVAFLTSNIIASPVAPPAGPSEISKQFTKFLNGINLDNYEIEKTVYVDFMVNDKSEIIVISTNSRELDSVLKKRLNYKLLETDDLELFHRYTVSVSFKK